MGLNGAAERYDIIIVGGGAAGCVLGSRLSEDRGLRIAIIEAGGSARRAIVRHPAGVRWLVGNPRYDWNHRTAPDASVGGRSSIWPSGRVLGGGGSINTMFYIWGEQADFDWWTASGVRGWRYDDVLPFYRRIEDCRFGDADFRGRGGPLTIRALEPDAHPVARHMVEGMVRQGFRQAQDYNQDHGAGLVSYGQVNQRGGRRSSPALDYPGLDGRRANLDILLNVTCDRLVIEEGRVVGVVVRDANGVRTLHAEREVVLSAGSIASPTILMRSGIGPAVQLRELGIDVVLARTAVGQNLQEHCGVRLMRAAEIPSINMELRGPAAIGAALRYLWGRGLLANLVSQASAYFLADDAVPESKVKISMFPFGYEVKGKGIALARRSMATFTVDLCWPNARGSVSLRSPDAADQPLIDYGMLVHPLDRKWMTSAVMKAQTLLSHPAMHAVFGQSLAPAPDIQNEADIDAYVEGRIEPFYHPSGTCRMGEDDAAVVDSQLRVRGIAGLRVADVSVSPRIVSSNTNATAMMIGERAAHFMRA